MRTVGRGCQVRYVHVCHAMCSTLIFTSSSSRFALLPSVFIPSTQLPFPVSLASFFVVCQENRCPAQQPGWGQLQRSVSTRMSSECKELPQVNTKQPSLMGRVAIPHKLLHSVLCYIVIKKWKKTKINSENYYFFFKPNNVLDFEHSLQILSRPT